MTANWLSIGVEDDGACPSGSIFELHLLVYPLYEGDCMANLLPSADDSQTAVHRSLVQDVHWYHTVRRSLLVGRVLYCIVLLLPSLLALLPRAEESICS